MISRGDPNKKTARLAVRTTPEIAEIVQRAASLQGRSVSEFMVTASLAAAEAATRQHKLLTLSQDEEARFVDAILNPPQTPPAFDRAIDAHGKLIRPS